MKTFTKCSLVALWCLLGALLWSCNTSPNSNDADAASASTKMDNNGEKNIALVHKFLIAQMSGDEATMRKMVTPDFYNRNPAGDSLAIDRFVNTWVGLSKSRNFQDAGVFATNSQIVTEGPLKGEWALFWGTYTAVDIQSGTGLEVLWHADFEIKDGKIKRSVSYFNMVDPQEAG